MAEPIATQSYDEVWAEVYGDMQEHGPVHRHMRRILRQLLAPLEYSSVADVGCGAGHNLALLAEGGRPERITGVDVSARALQGAAAAGYDETLQADIEAGGIEGSWDLVFSSLVLEHLPDDLAALRSMRAMCAEDGSLVVTTIAGPFERYRKWDEQMGHVRNYRRGELEGKLEAAGFTVERAIYWGFPFYSPLVRLLQNGMRSEPSYGRGTRLLAALLYRLYFLSLPGRGDLLLVRARARGVPRRT